MRTLVARLTQVTPIAMGAAVGLIVVGGLALIGGGYDHRVVRDQLRPQKIFFPPKGSKELFPDIRKYGGQQVDTAGEAKAYADKFIARHLKEIGGGKTYAEASAQSLKNPKDPKAQQLTLTLFRGETLRGLLLNAWGWGSFGTIVIAAGIILIVLGALLFLIPLLNWLLNERRRGRPASTT